MSDAELRALEQRFHASGSLEDECALLRARLKCGDLDEVELRLAAYRGEPAARAALHGAPDLDRWEPLRQLIERWYAEPLSPADGNSAEEIRAAERRLGAELPPCLREWYRLVGRRVRSVGQDDPVPLEELRLEDGFLALLLENQGVWVGGVLFPAGPQPRFEVDRGYEEPDPYRAPIPVALQHHVLFETVLFAVHEVEDPAGPLGVFRPGLVEVEQVRGFEEAYPLLLSPDWLYGPAHGDADTLICDNYGIARTEAAYKRLNAFT